MNHFEVPEDLIHKVASGYEGAEREFFVRVWGGGIGVYGARLDAIGFQGMANVLECGFGMGTWLFALAQRNTFVEGIDYDPRHIATAQQMITALDLGERVRVQQGTVESLPYPDASFDAVFCYGALFATDARRSLGEMRRVLKPGGRVYFTSNGLGWFLHMLLDEEGTTAGYVPRDVAIRALANTLDYLGRGVHHPGAHLAIPPAVMRSWLAADFDEVRSGPEGSLHEPGSPAPSSFYQFSEAHGQDAVYEVLARRISSPA
ncbi:MAG: class I SAM-dependent methyltransferase [Polyangiaceae bacterium]|nr:class I SAM-dependent methyltransferase [Polyangiaceae bacterium]